MKKEYNVISETVNKYYEKKVVAILIYGSFAKNMLTQYSDIDIAVLLQPELKSNFKINIDIMLELEELLNRKIDLVILNETSTILKMQILKNNNCIYISDKIKYANWIMNTISEYHDLKISRQKIEHAIIKDSIYG